MSFLASWLRRMAGSSAPAAPLHPLEILRLTCTIDVRTAERVYLIQETRWRSLTEGLDAYEDLIPIGAGRIERLQSSVGRADLLDAGAGQARLRLHLPDPLPAGAETTQLLSAILADPFPDLHPRLTIRPAYPAAAIGLTIIFPLTRPARDFALHRAGHPNRAPDPVAPQPTPRADGRLAYVWLKPDPPSDAAYELTWRWT